MSRMPPPEIRGRGFTLVELLVALTIMAIIAGLLSSSMRFSLGAAEKVETRIESIESLHQSQRAFRRQVQLALPVPRVGDDEPLALDFAASASRLEFIAPLPGLDTGGMLYRISLRIEDARRNEADEARVIMSYGLYLDGSRDRRQDLQTREVILIDGLSDASFSYLDTIRPNGGAWMDDWQFQERLPDLVRLTVSLEGEEAADAMNLVVAIKATLPSRYSAS